MHCISSLASERFFRRAPVITHQFKPSTSTLFEAHFSLGRVSLRFLRAFISCAGTRRPPISLFPDRRGISLVRNSTHTAHLYCSPRMSGKLNSFSEKQARDRLQSDCRLLRVSEIRRSPFADITNDMVDGRLRRHNEPTSPPPQSRTLNGMALQSENVAEVFDSGNAQNCRAGSIAPLRNRRSFRPSPAPLTSRTGYPSPLEGVCSTSPVKVDSGVPSVCPLGSVPQLKGDTLRSRPSLRQASLGSGVPNQYPHDSGLCGESTRESLSTSLLPSKTHKLAGGQLAILPSRSVLVDFREGERRKGRKGEEVMVVSPNGDQVSFVSSGIKELDSEIPKIHLFSAPHLSTPCCLAEPIATYSLDDLPAAQYKLYEQAKKVVEHIKRNVTKVRPAGSMNISRVQRDLLGRHV
jgi:hypothetical protein